ncbi:hypothetical protein CANINC_004033 [Pichia inconspicua]|uniref:Alcohol acetyltransferase n=1 Tax=Pichia inconspicua TaxID=52247 RepID=A0A4V4NFB0_9ASCO|nr:hypothetical protein CANINC_004033 [[Candida] inconspicua]
MSFSRPLDFLEKYYFWRTKLNYYSNCRIVAEYNLLLSEETVFNALERMLRTFPQLCTTISRNGDNAHLIHSLLFKDVVEFIEDDCLNDPEVMLNKFHNDAFEFSGDNVVWKLKVINKKFLMFYFDHILYDGGSGKNFHEEFSKALASPDGKSILKYRNSDSLVFQRSNCEPYNIMPSPSQIIDYSSSWGGLIYTFFMMLAPSFITKFIRRMFDQHPYAKLLSYKRLSLSSTGLISDHIGSRCKVFHIPTYDLKGLLKLCTKNGVKLTSLIATISQMSLGNIIKTNEDTKIDIPVDIRKFIKEDKGKALSPKFSNVFGLFMSAVQVDVPSVNKLQIDDGLNWNFVSYVHNKIHNEIPFSPRLVGLLKFVDPKKFVMDKIKNKEIGNLEVSNLGVISPQGSAHIVNVWFDQPPQMFSINVISSSAGANLVMRTCDPSMLDRFHSEFVKLTNGILSSLN